MDETHVVTCFLRQRGEVLLLDRSEAVGSYSGQWGAVSAHPEGDPDAAARQAIAEQTGLDGRVTLIRAGEPLDVVDEGRDTRWVVYPYLFDSDDRTVEPNWETSTFEWVHPTAILRRETVPALWASYERVRPTVETVQSDWEHGSAWLSMRALAGLRDEAGQVATGTQAGDWDRLADVATDLRAARPSMPVIENRVNRVMARADQTPASIETTAIDGLARAADADSEAARTAAERLPDRVATLSRSGTVLATLDRATPEAVLIAESRPGEEGVDVAASLAGEMDVTLSPDAGLAWAIYDWDAEALLVGADAIYSAGTVRNKVGTRSAALDAAYEGIDVLVVASVDKIDPDPSGSLERADPATIYDGPAAISPARPIFDETPPDLIDAICTERGVLSVEDIEDIARAHRANADWSA
ncbi:initiation factor 2B [Halorhabdus sp. CBA1104]|uniref:NUDIX domain-containing protein n=1 Tax=Halorhabdus sp. CBA1104 TaxID=1380432 RepID=UPI0012B1A33C|nr:NUDIX domain-containing protein [Halorhabdus sp. CBA1104]QGN07613.1 initiation factor 2B [Halorhabdus sp. CBA1104]